MNIAPISFRAFPRVTACLLLLGTTLFVASSVSAQSPKARKGKPVEATYADEMNPAYAAVQINTAADPSGKPAQPAGFNHPGVLLNRAQLEEIKRRVAEGIEPQKSAFAKLKASPWAALDYEPRPVPTVMSGPRSNPEVGAKAEQADSAAAYTQALLWCITGEEIHAQNAVKILNAWASTLTGGHRHANGPVQAAWTGSVFSRAAEIIRYTYPKWSEAEIAACQNMFRTQFLPFIIHGNCENGNKELAMAEALVNIGVFNDDRAVFDLGLRMWRARTPAYIYLKSDGDSPVLPPGCGMPYWSNKGHMPELVDGLTQEAARDSHHSWMAFASMTNAAETALNQGVDLYAEETRRMMAAMEFVGRHLPPNNEPAPEKLDFSLQPTWEIAYNHFHHRLGHALPKIAAVLPLNRPTVGRHHMLWETLTHAEMGAVGLPAGAARK
jgi:hypothetical protein